MVAASIASLKVAVTAVFTATPVVPADGLCAVTVGGIVVRTRSDINRNTGPRYFQIKAIVNRTALDVDC